MVNPAPIRASSQEHLPIEDIVDNLVVLKGGSCCLVLLVRAINFGLLSEREQDAMIFAYASLLNSLNFPIQILVSSKKKDISEYLALLDEQEEKLKEEKLKKRLKKYKKFIEETVGKHRVLGKKFFIVIPFSVLKLGAKAGMPQLTRKKGLPFPLPYILQRAKDNLYPKRDQLIKLLKRLGLQARQLKNEELVQVFFKLYNQEAPAKPGPLRGYQTPLVEAAQSP